MATTERNNLASQLEELATMLRSEEELTIKSSRLSKVTEVGEPTSFTGQLKFSMELYVPGLQT